MKRIKRRYSGADLYNSQTADRLRFSLPCSMTEAELRKHVDSFFEGWEIVTLSVEPYDRLDYREWGSYDFQTLPDVAFGEERFEPEDCIDEGD